MTVEDWLRAACADAERRGLNELKPLLTALAHSTTNLRRADADIAPASADGGDTTPDARS